MSSYTSDELYHLVGRLQPNNHDRNYEILTQKILRNKCISHPPHTNDSGKIGYSVNWGKTLLSEDQELFIPFVVCFCDIRWEHLQIHMRKYGRFGLSFSRDFLIRNGARPVQYIPLHRDDWRSVFGGHEILKDMEAIYRGFREFLYRKRDGTVSDGRGIGAKVTTTEQALSGVDYAFSMYFLSFIKPFNSHRDDSDPLNYYMEREWRKFGNLRFQASDVTSISVAAGYTAKFAAEFPEYADRIRESP